MAETRILGLLKNMKESLYMSNSDKNKQLAPYVRKAYQHLRTYRPKT